MSEQKPHTDSLLDCLVEVLQDQDIATSSAALTAGLPLVDGQLSPELFVRAAQRAGIRAEVKKRKIADIPDIVLPVVLLLKNNTAVLLRSFDSEKQILRLYNPAKSKEIRVHTREFQSFYSGYCIFTQVRPAQEMQQELQPDKKQGHWFWSVIFSSWRIYRDVLLASFFINLFAVASPLFVMNVYDRVVPNNAVETLWALAIGVIVVFVFDAVLKFLRGYFLEVAGKKSDILLSAVLYERVLGAKYSEKPRSTGSFIAQFKEFDSVRNFYTSSSLAVLIDLPFIALFLLLVYFIGGSLVWVPLLALPVVLVYTLILQGPIKRAVEETFASAAQKNATLVESLVGLETVKAQVAEGFLQRSWEKSVAHLSQWSQRMRILSLSVNIFSGAVQQIAGVVLIIVGVYLIIDRDLTMGALIASYMLTARALGPVAQMASLIVSYDQTKTALTALNEIVHKPQERDPGNPFVSRSGFSGGIAFRQVDFAYPGEKQSALAGISFNVQPGEKVGIIGRIGSGKSTIQNLILGFYQPGNGSVLVDGIDVQQIDPSDLRKHIGYVPQDVVLFAGSVKANITYGTAHVSDEDVVLAAGHSGVQEFVNRHPLGFDREVGERGLALSGGQRQSIGMARALLHDPAILLMDEPTSGMDNSTETLIKRNLMEISKDKTLVLVTHKTSLLDLVDRLIVMDGGSIIADGPKESVLEALKKGQLNVSQPS